MNKLNGAIAQYSALLESKMVSQSGMRTDGTMLLDSASSHVDNKCLKKVKSAITLTKNEELIPMVGNSK